MVNRGDALVLGIDPGSEYVGWSLSRGEERSDNYGIESPSEFLIMLETHFINVDRAAIERFDMRQFTTESALTVETIGIIKWILNLGDISFGFVNPADKHKYLEMITSRDPELRSHAADAEAVRLWDLDYGKWR